VADQGFESVDGLSIIHFFSMFLPYSYYNFVKNKLQAKQTKKYMEIKRLKHKKS